jgi:hypothetical protein
VITAPPRGGVRYDLNIRNYLIGPAGLPYLDLFFMTAAVATCLNLHHFLLDGRIWRMRERAVLQTMLA